MGIPVIERKAALTLFPYFNKGETVIVDVGSNKGDWTDILVRNVDKAILFEPNEKLLHYSEIRFDELNNVGYWGCALSSEAGEAKFYYFDNVHNGLSSLLQIPSWKDLNGKKECVVNVDTLDNALYFLDISFLKIDAEGNDLNVLYGAKKLLSKRKIQFIQIEYGPGHWALASHTFQDMINFVTPFGYGVFHFDGERFTRIEQKTGAENFYIMDANFTQNWNGQFIKNTIGIKVDFALEIGCFEGLTSNYICDNIINHGGRMICVDPLTDEYLPGHKDNEMFKGQYERFIRNTKGRPIELIRKKSIDAYEQLKDYRFGFIYIDGDHTEDGVFNDGVKYWNVLKENGGLMLFDDYGQSEETKRGIDRFLDTQKGNFELLVKDYQVLIRRKW